MIHTGNIYTQGNISIGPPEVGHLRHIQVAEDVRESFPYWLDLAQERSDILYFCIFLDKNPIGQILLHDRDLEKSESLVAYHLFDVSQRGRGVGTAALHLLQQYVVENTTLSNLVIITSRDNFASIRVAQKCKFEFAGASREDPENTHLYKWTRPVLLASQSSQDHIFKDWFKQELSRLIGAVGLVTEGGIIDSIQHIGATSMPGLPGSSCIDFALAAWPFPLEAAPKAALEALGYAPVAGYEGAPQQRFRQGNEAFQLFVFEPGSEHWADYTLTSEYLRRDVNAFRLAVAWKNSLGIQSGTQEASVEAAKTRLFGELVGPARQWWIDNIGFAPVRRVAGELQAFPLPWYISSGWALDLLLGRVSRFHHDVDVVIDRNAQLALQEYMIGRGWKFVTPFKKRLESWPPFMRLELPRHQAHAHREGDFIDFLLTEFTQGIWRYRREPVILRGAERMSLRSDSETGIPFLAPELVLLFKSKNTGSTDRSKDEVDFENIYPLLDDERRAWLRWALIATNPSHPWIGRLA